MLSSAVTEVNATVCTFKAHGQRPQAENYQSYLKTIVLKYWWYKNHLVNL